MSELDDLRGRYSAKRTARFVELATAGGDIDRVLRAVIRDIAALGPPGEYLRDELALARRAAKRGDSAGSIGRMVDLTRWALSILRVPDLACLLSAAAINMRNDLGDRVGPEDSAALDYIAGRLAFDLLDYEAAHEVWTRALATAEETPGRDLVADLLLNLGNIARSQDRNEEAARLVHEAAAEYERQGDRTGLAQAMLSLGYMAADARQFDEARLWLDSAEPLLRSRDAADSRAGFHHLRAVLHVEAGEYAQAEASWKRALAAARRAGDTDKEVTALQNLAAVAGDAGNRALSLRRTRAAVEAAAQHHLLLRLTALLPALVRAEAIHGNSKAALDVARALVEVAEAVDQGIGEAHALLGAALVDNNLTEEGLAELEHAWEILSDDQSEPAVRVRPHLIHNLIVGYSDAGMLDTMWELAERRCTQLEFNEWARALEHLGLAMVDAGVNQDATARVLLRSLKSRRPAERAWASLPIGNRAHQAGQHLAAIAVFDVGLKTATRRRQVTTARQIRNDLALALTDSYNFRRAESLLSRNLTEAVSDDDDLTRALALHNLAEINRRTERPEAAERYARAAVEAARRTGDTEEEAGALVQLGMALSDMGEYPRAVDSLNLVLDRSAPGTRDHGAALHMLGAIELAQGDPVRAVELYREALKTEIDRPVAYAETLFGYIEALATVGDRRTYNRMMQPLLDAVQQVPFSLDYAIRLTHVARAWSRRERPKFAGEMLAMTVLVSATDAQEAFPSDPTQKYSRLEGALHAVAAELHYEQYVERLADEVILLDAIRTELRNHLPAKAAQRVVSILRGYVRSIRDDD